MQQYQTIPQWPCVRVRLTTVTSFETICFSYNLPCAKPMNVTWVVLVCMCRLSFGELSEHGKESKQTQGFSLFPRHSAGLKNHYPIARDPCRSSLWLPQQFWELQPSPCRVEEGCTTCHQLQLYNWSSSLCSFILKSAEQATPLCWLVRQGSKLCWTNRVRSGFGWCTTISQTVFTPEHFPPFLHYCHHL